MQRDPAMVLLDGIAAGPGEKFHGRFPPIGRRHEFDDLLALDGGVADQPRAAFLEIPQVGAVQRHVELIVGPAFQKPMPIGAVALQQAVAAGQVLPIDAGDGVFFPAPPGTDLNSRGAAEAEALLQKSREHGMRTGRAARTAAAQRPAGAAKEMRNASPQQPDERARLRHLPFRSQQQMGSRALAGGNWPRWPVLADPATGSASEPNCMMRRVTWTWAIMRPMRRSNRRSPGAYERIVERRPGIRPDSRCRKSPRGNFPRPRDRRPCSE